MARHRGAVVRKIYSRETGLELEMRLDKSRMEFYCELPNGFIVHALVAADVEKEVNRILAEIYAIQWQPVIIVTEKHAFGDNARNSPYIGVSSKRLWLGQKHDGGWMIVRHWDVDFNRIGSYHVDHFYVRRPPLVIPGRLDDEDVILAYNEDTWLGLQKLEAAIGELRNRVRELIGNEEGWQRLALVGRNNLSLLGAGDGS